MEGDQVKLPASPRELGEALARVGLRTGLDAKNAAAGK